MTLYVAAGVEGVWYTVGGVLAGVYSAPHIQQSDVVVIVQSFRRAEIQYTV